MTDNVAGTSSAQDEGSTVEQVTGQAREQAGQLGERIQTTAREQIDQRSTQAGEKVSSLASDLRSVGDQLQSDGNEGGAKIANQVAERAERAGRYLSHADGTRILDDVEDLGRRRPWLALAGGVALGVVAARFLKASSSERYRSRTTPKSGAGDRHPSSQVGFTGSAYGNDPRTLDRASEHPAPTPVGFGGDA
jgi:hypothetical protein